MSETSRIRLLERAEVTPEIAAAFEMFPRFVDGLRIPLTPPPAAQ